MNRKPDWLRKRHINNPNQKSVEQTLKRLNLNTVCAEANCPNYNECFSRKTATFMIMGINCTRNCGFCNVHHGTPLPLDTAEPQNVAQAVKELGLEYVVVTSVTRDDLQDGGALHFAKTIHEIRRVSPKTAIEVLIPDFKGDLDALKTIANACPDVISHNMETVHALYNTVRPEAQYRRSLEVLKNIKILNPHIRSKSGIMVGFGETEEQVFEMMDDLRSVGCEFLTIGQYLAPTKNHLPVYEYVEPVCFDAYARAARQKGFSFVASAPLVRSSYNAAEAISHVFAQIGSL